MEDMSVVRTGTFWEKVMGAKSFEMLVGAAGFEPATSCAQGKRATRLRHAPNWLTIAPCNVTIRDTARTYCAKLRVQCLARRPGVGF